MIQETLAGEDIIRTLILPKLDVVRKEAGGWKARCPAHDDDDPSLSISVGGDPPPGKNPQPVVLNCFAGCTAGDILAKLGLTLASISSPREPAVPAQDTWASWQKNGCPCAPIARYSYCDEDGTLLYQHVRGQHKEFAWRRPDPSSRSGWRWSLGDVRRVLYRLPALVNTTPRRDVIWYVEGEKDVDTLTAHGEIAVTAGAAGDWKAEFARFFVGHDVLIVADRDKAGRDLAEQVTADLAGIAGFTWVVEAREGKDATDHFTAGYGITDFTWLNTED